MSALDTSRALNALKLKLQSPAVNSVSATSPARSTDGKDESSKATFSRLLAHSRAAAAAAKQPPEVAARTTAKSESPARTSRPADSRTKDNTDKPAEVHEPRTSTTPSRGSAADRSTAASEASKRPADAEAAAERGDAANATDDEAPPISSAGVANDLLSLLPGGLPLAASATPAAADAGLATGDVLADVKLAAAPLSVFGKAVDGLAGTDAPATSDSGLVGAAAGIAAAVDGATAADRSPGQVAQAVSDADLKLASDATSATAALPNAVPANLAALSVGAGKSDEAPKASTSPGWIAAGLQHRHPRPGPIPSRAIDRQPSIGQCHCVDGGR